MIKFDWLFWLAGRRWGAKIIQLWAPGEFGKRFGDDAYAFEELCAEMTSALLGADLGLPTSHLDDHAAYIGSWLKVLRKDSRAIMTAAAKAEAAAG